MQISKRPILVGLAIATVVLSIAFLRSPQADSPANPPTAANATYSLSSSELAAATATLASYTEAQIQSDNALLAHARELAAQRRSTLLRLLQDDPQAALAHAFSYADYAALPPEIQPLVETPFSTTADLSLIAVCDHDPATPELKQSLAFSLGDRAQLSPAHFRRAGISKEQLPVQGIRLDDWAAVRPQVFQELDGEDRDWALAALPSAHADPTLDFATGEAIEGEALLAVSGGYRFHFANRETLQTLEAELERLDSLPGLDVGSPALLAKLSRKESERFNLPQFVAAQEQEAATNAVETRPYLIIRVDFEDKTETPFSKMGLEDLVNLAVAPALANYSYNKTTVAVSVSNTVYRLGPSANYGDEQDIHDEAVQAYIANGNADPNTEYDHVSVSFPKLDFPWSGIATVGGREQWLHGPVQAGTILHELGHNYGLSHANYWVHDASDANSADPVNPSGENEEYGDVYDIMGDGEVAAGHVHMAGKQYLGWLENTQWEDVATPSDSGVYRIYQFDTVSASGLQALRVSKEVTSDHYWVGFRQLYPGVPYFDKGAYLVWERAAQPNNFNSQSWLVDTSPGSPDGKLDAGLPLGKTYSDSASEVHLTPLSVGQNASGDYLDIAVHLGSFPGNSPPSGTLTASASGVARSPVSFSFSANDPDGDPLAYHWDFGDGTVEVNAASVDHSFPVGGVYTLTVTVSDMKGGTYTEQATVEISDPINEINERDSLTSSDLTAIAANETHVVVGGRSGTFLQSEDGSQWINRSLGFGNVNVRIRQIIWTGSEFLAAGSDYDSDLESWVGVIYRSPDGASWTRVLRTETAMGSWGFVGIAANPSTSLVAAVGSDARVFLRNVDSSWSEGGTIRESGDLGDSAGVVFHNGSFLVGAYHFDPNQSASGLVLARSADGASWEDLSGNSGFESWKGLDTLAHLNGALLGSGFTSRIRYSDDGGETWNTNEQGATHEVNAFAFGNGIYSAYGEVYGEASAEPNIPQNFLSTDGRNWKAAGAPPEGVTYHARVFFKDTFVSVGDAGLIHQSSAFEASAESPFLAWIVGFTTDSEKQGALANPDGDWAPNFLEYALGSDPVDAASVPEPPQIAFADDGRIVVSIARFAKTEVSLSLEMSADLENWSALPALATVDNEVLLQLVSVEAHANESARFVRIKASQ